MVAIVIECTTVLNLQRYHTKCVQKCIQTEAVFTKKEMNSERNVDIHQN